MRVFVSHGEEGRVAVDFGVLKERNPACENIESFIIDKDFSEIGAIKAIFIHATVSFVSAIRADKFLLTFRTGVSVSVSRHRGG
jgi:hypothetical protein